MVQFIFDIQDNSSSSQSKVVKANYPLLFYLFIYFYTALSSNNYLFNLIILYNYLLLLFFLLLPEGKFKVFVGLVSPFNVVLSLLFGKFLFKSNEIIFQIKLSYYSSEV